MATVAIIVGFILMLAGLAGTLIPAFPDTLLALVGGAIVLLRDGFSTGDLPVLGVLLLIVAAAEGLTYLAQGFGAKKAGASRAGVAGALIGGLVGLFVFPPWGVLLGPLLGALLGELIAGKQGASAMKAGVGAVLGVVAGVALKVAAVVTMIGLVTLSVIL